MLIKGLFIESIDALTINAFDGYIRLDESGRICERGENLQVLPDEEVHDYTGSIILQGFCDMHLHAPQYPIRAVGLDLTLIDWLNTHTFPAERAFEDADYARKVSACIAKELVQNGTTRVSMYASIHTDSAVILMEELEKAGISGYVGKVNMDRNGGENYEESTEESISETMRFIGLASKFQGIKPSLTPRFIPTCTDELMYFLGNLCSKGDIASQSHLSENTDEVAWVRELCPDCDDYFEAYKKRGFWNERTIMAHCVHSDEREQLAMRDAGVHVAHCPDSNINIMSGFSPIRQMLDRGVKVVLGSDVAGGDQVSMFRVMRAAIQTSKIRAVYENEEPIDAKAAYYMATSGAQGYFGAGSGFCTGDKLHAVVVDDSTWLFDASAAPEDRLQRAIYLTRPTDVAAVYGGGRRLK